MLAKANPTIIEGIAVISKIAINGTITNLIIKIIQNSTLLYFSKEIFPLF